MKLLIVLMSFLASTAFAGIKDGGGGSGVAAEFVELAHDLEKRLESKSIPGVDVEAFRKAVNETKVITKRNLKLRGATVDAINYPGLKLIEVSVTRWNKLTKTPWVKLQIVFHEYLGILQIDDSNYQISRQILNSDLCNRTPGIVAAVETAVRRSCDQVTLHDLSYVTDLTIRELDRFKASDFKDLTFLARLEINSEILNITIDRELTKNLPALFTLMVTTPQTVVEPGAFVNSTLSFLQLANPQLRKGSLRGLKAEIVMFTNVPGEAAALKLQEALATEDYACSADENATRGVFTLGCQKI